jgi:ribosomal protein L35
MKGNKSYSKRIKLTRTGKLVARKAGQCHFNAKESRNTQLDKNRTTLVQMSNKSKTRFLSNM